MQGNKVTARILKDCENFATYKISQCCEFATSYHCSPFLLFDVLTIIMIFPNLPFMYNGYLRCFCNFAYSENYISSEKFLYRDLFFAH